MSFSNSLSGLFLFIGLLMGFSLLRLNTYIHELGHCIATRYYASKTPVFTDSLFVEIIIRSCLEGTTKSNYLRFLSNNKDKPTHLKYISFIAIAGCLLSTLIWTGFIVLTFLFLIPLSNIFFLLLGVLFTPLVIGLLTFFITGESKTADFFIARNPHEYIYRY